MKTIAFLVVWATALVNGSGFGYQSAPAGTKHHHLSHHYHHHHHHQGRPLTYDYIPANQRTAFHKLTNDRVAYDVHHPKVHEKQASPLEAFVSSAESHFRKFPLTPLNSFRGIPSLVPINKDYPGSIPAPGNPGLRKQYPLAPGATQSLVPTSIVASSNAIFPKQPLTSGTVFQKPLTNGATFHGQQTLTPGANFHGQQTLTPGATFQKPLTSGANFHGQHLASGNFFQKPLTSGATIHGQRTLVPATYVAPSSTVQKQPFTSSGTVFQNHQKLTSGADYHGQQPLASGVTFPRQQSLVPATYVAPVSSSIQRQPLASSGTVFQSHQQLTSGATFHGQQSLVPATYVAPVSSSIQKQPLASSGTVFQSHPQLTSGATFHGQQSLVPATYVAPVSSSIQKQPLTSSGTVFQSQQPLTSGATVHGQQPWTSGTVFQSHQPLTSGATVHGHQPLTSGAASGVLATSQKLQLTSGTDVQGHKPSAPGTPSVQKAPLAAVLPPPKRPYSFSYTANPVRKVVEVAPQQGVIAGTIPYPVLVQTPTGPKYGTYNQPAALTYKYNATKVHYKPVEAHGYQVRY